MDEYEHRQLAAQLWYLRQDFAEGTADKGFLHTIDLIYNTFQGFPEESAFIEKLLENPEWLQNLRDELEQFVQAYGENRELLRFHFHQPQKLLERISDLQREPLHFTAAEKEKPQRHLYISMDEIDRLLRGGKRSTDSQFEKIPMSAERQQAILERQIEEIMRGIEQAKAQKAERYTVKQLERTRKSLEAKLAKLNDQSRKDDVVTFEQLGVDRLFVDESHYFKNLFLATKMRNVGGIAQTEAQKSSDLFMKCQYLDELTDGRGVIFATGTPISNSMVELYTIQRYLQYRLLQELGLIHFDDWASNFGETITAIELSPEGTGYQAKTRFAKFYNLPELMAAFKEVADIQTADILKLPVPKANFHNEVIKPSELQKEMIQGLAERAEKIRGGGVDPHVDNMLRITNDGRKLALDMRLINPLAADDPNGKVSVCARNVYRIWEQTKEKRSAQLVFCDLSTPTKDGSFNVYDDLKKKLMDAGIPEEEIAFIHTADSEAKKKDLFSKVRSGQVRVLLGSTAKMGAGTNVQDRLIALHDLDCPWRPSDVGRILRTFKIKRMWR
ncbi:hypothetical protein [Acutalibacter muris]|uniref:hypothetical protein n=1 Tax=Acutalibacter muris TaxID=1796620 RepID=UPI00272A75A3|nr:hypothetical protein [Acutalibacter muris]